MLENYRTGLETGDFLIAGFSLAGYSAHAFATGSDLRRLEKDMHTHVQAIRQIKNVNALDIISIYLQLIKNLRNPSDFSTKLSGPIFNEDKSI